MLDVLRRLESLDPDMASADDVAGIIGNSSWTDIRCNGCGDNCEAAVQVGEEENYDSSTATLCRNCLTAAIAVLTDAEVTK